MKTPRPANVGRLLLATSILVSGAAPSAAFGHAHSLPNGVHHVHDEWDPPGHSHPDDEDDGDDAAVITASVFHVHAVWFGIPFTLPVPSDHDRDRSPLRPWSANSCFPRPTAAGTLCRGALGEEI